MFKIYLGLVSFFTFLTFQSSAAEKIWKDKMAKKNDNLPIGKLSFLLK